MKDKVDRQEERQQEEGEMNKASDKTKEEILAERQAKKTAKPVKKIEPKVTGTSSPQVKTNATKPVVAGKSLPQKSATSKPNVTSAATKQISKPLANSPKVATMPLTSPVKIPEAAQPDKPQESEKTKEQIHQEREARRLAKLAAKKKSEVPEGAQQSPPETKPAPGLKKNSDTELATKMEDLHIEDAAIDSAKAKPVTKAERRAIQEAQRAAKAKALEEKKPVAKKPAESKKPQAVVAKQVAPAIQAIKNSAVHKVKLFKHLYTAKCDLNIKVNQSLHPAIVKLGLQFANDAIVGSNARCYAFLNAMKIVSSLNSKRTFRDVASYSHFSLSTTTLHLQRKCSVVGLKLRFTLQSNFFKAVDLSLSR